MVRYLPPRYKNINVPVYITEQKKNKILAIPHFHESIEFIRVECGDVECCIGTEKYKCSAGDIIFIPPYALHGVISLNDDSVIRGVVFKMSLVVGENSMLPIKNILSKDRITTPVFKYKTEINIKIGKSFQNAVDLYSAERITYELDIKSVLCNLLSLVVSEYYINSDDIEKCDRLIPVMDYIKCNYKEQIHISELSGILNICDDHLIRLFRETIGITPMKYINRIRLEEAQKMLVNTDYSVTEISYRAGFSNISYFSKIFTDVFEQTPRQYRRKNCLKI